jgi:hypothetical protein
MVVAAILYEQNRFFTPPEREGAKPNRSKFKVCRQFKVSFVGLTDNEVSEHSSSCKVRNFTTILIVNWL